MRNYEYTLIVSPLVSEEKLNEKISEFVSFMQEQGGILEKQAILGKRALESPIGKFKEGYLVLISFFANPEPQETLTNHIKQDSDILRFLPLIKAPVKRQQKRQSVYSKETAAAKEGEHSVADATSTESDSTKEKQYKEQPANLADIDKQLEEIFKEDE